MAKASDASLSARMIAIALTAGATHACKRPPRQDKEPARWTKKSAWRLPAILISKFFRKCDFDPSKLQALLHGLEGGRSFMMALH
jgi:hypothetical protein